MTALPTPPLSRRRLLALTGAGAAAGSSAFLAACGAAAEQEDEASPEEQATALNEVLAQQLAVRDAAKAVEALQRSGPPGPPEEAVAANAALLNLRDRSIQELRKAISELGGNATKKPALRAAQAESPVEGLARQLDASLAACTRAIGQLAPEQRQPVQRAVAEDAATLAVMRSVLDEDPAPDAFVLGTATGAES